MDKVTLSRQDVMGLLGAIEAAGQHASGLNFKVVYACKRTCDSLRAEVEAMQLAQRPAPAFVAFDEQRQALCREYAVQEHGEPKRVSLGDGRFAFDIDPERRGEFDERLTALRDEHQAAIDAETARQTGIAEWLREPITVSIHRIASTDFPTAGCTLQQQMALLPLFNDLLSADGAE